MQTRIACALRKLYYYTRIRGIVKDPFPSGGEKNGLRCEARGGACNPGRDMIK
jgi:hypothetical protein